MDGLAWAMAAHIIALGVWSAALVLLAGLYALAPSLQERAEVQRHRVMCRYVFVILASPAAVLAILTGSVLVLLLGVEGSWLLAKLAVVALMALYHTYCGHLLDSQGMESRRSRPRRRHPILIGLPLVLISMILFLVLAKPDVVFEYEVAPKPASHRDEGSAQQREIQTTGAYGSEWVIQTG